MFDDITGTIIYLIGIGFLTVFLYWRTRQLKKMIDDQSIVLIKHMRSLESNIAKSTSLNDALAHKDQEIQLKTQELEDKKSELTAIYINNIEASLNSPAN